MQHLVEVLVADHADRGVIFCLDRRCALRSGQKSDFSEVLSRVDCALESFLSVLVLHEAFALSLGDNEEVVVLLTLLNLDFLWLAHHELNLGDHIVFHVRIEREY